MKKGLAMGCALGALFALIACSGLVIDSCRAALRLCGELIIPSLFPFFVLSILLNRLGLPALLSRAAAPVSRLLFGVSGAGSSALIMGLTGGYPLGAVYIADMLECGAVDEREAEQLMGFCNNSGPAFIIGAVGAGVFSSARAGLYLYGIHIAAAVLTGIVLRPSRRTGMPVPQAAQTQEHPVSLPFSQAFSGAVRQALGSLVNVCGFVICFSVLVGLLDAHGGFSLLAGRIAALTGFELHWVRAFLTGVLELGSGVGAMRGLSVHPMNLALAAFLLGWGGVSVHFQTMALIAQRKIKGVLHFAGRLLSGSFSAVAAYYMYGLFF